MARITEVFAAKEEFVKCPKAQDLLKIIQRKETNLCVSADVSTSAELLQLVDEVGPFVCMVKTHIDIIVDFTAELITQLQALAAKHDFAIFEDRKFADLGSTVQKQFSGGVHQISTWADFINAHAVVGPGIISGLKSVAQGQSLIMIAQMSAAGNLCTPEYTKTSVDMAEANSGFVSGFICTERVTENREFLNFVPGVHISSSGDNLGQQYVSPESAIKRGADVIIVGRGIYRAENFAKAARQYRDACRDAFSDISVKGS
eukprot:sb/3468457/